MLTITFEGPIQIFNGDMVEILRGIRTNETTIRACHIRNITQGGWTKKSHIDGMLMTQDKENFNPPIVGKVVNLTFPNASDTVEFALAEDSKEDNLDLDRAAKNEQDARDMRAGRKSAVPEPREYDVSISYAREDEGVAEDLERRLRVKGVRVFLDKLERHRLWGKDLGTYFEQIFGVKAVFVVVLLSRHYAAKEWTDYEFECAKKEARQRTEEFILPIRLDDAIKPGLKSSICYMDYRKEGAEDIAVSLTRKLHERSVTQPLLKIGEKKLKSVRTLEVEDIEDTEATLKGEDEVCLVGPFEVDPGGYVLLPLNLSQGDAVSGTIDEAEGNTFDWYVVDEKNMVKFKRKEEFNSERWEVDEGASHLRKWTVQKDGPWYLVLSAYGKKYPRKIAVRLRKLRI